MINWAFRQFAQTDIADAGTRMATAEVWMGDAPSVGLTTAEDLSLLVPVLSQGNIDAEVVYLGPIEAPIAAGQQLAELVIRFDDLPEKRIPLVADADVARGGFTTRMRTAALVLWGKFGPGSGVVADGA